MFGAYGIDRQIGAGGMGAVYAATDPKLNRQVALKVVLGEHAMSPTFLQRFQHEASVLARLDSPHVISVYDHGEQDGCPFIVVQYAAGGDLGQLLQHGALSRHAAVDLCAQVADGLVAAHGVGVVHRDVKPANVLLRDDRIDRLHAYLCDFGVALTESTGLTTPGAVAGTWNYLAPERSRGEQATPSSDVYSVGCLLWETLTGAPPYVGSDVEVAMEHLSAPVPQLRGTDDFTEHVNHVLGRSLAKEPADRYPSATELRDDLRALAASIAPSTAAGPHRRRRTGLVVAVGAVAVLAVAGGITAVALARGGAAPPPAGPSQPTTPAAIRGDIDGDGFGDIAFAGYGETSVYRSDGSSLASEPLKVTTVGKPLLTGHFSDEKNSPFVFVDRYPPTVSLRITDLEGVGPASLLRTKPADVLAYPDAAAGDFDGDGLDDVMIRVTNDQGTTISVGINNGDGTFAAGTAWYTEDLPGGGFVVGDVDGDGNDDVVQISPGDTLADPAATTVLRSTGSGFELAGSQEPAPEQLAEAAQMADVDGDGTPELVTASFFTSTVLVWRWDGEKFAAPDSWLPGKQISNDRAMTLSDVDGDGSADLVTATAGPGPRSVHVFLSTGTGFENASSWGAGVKPPESDDLVAPSQLQTFLNTN